MLLILFLFEGTVCNLLVQNIPVNILGFLERAIIWVFFPLIINVLFYIKNPYFKKLLCYFKQIIYIAGSKVKKNK